MKLEEPKLGFKIYRMAISKWMSKGCRKTDTVLSMCFNGSKNGLFCPNNAQLHSWTYLDQDQYLINMPSNFYDFIFISNVLEHYKIESSKKLIKECKRMLKKGGIIASYSKACNDGQEVYDIVKDKIVDKEYFLKNRLYDKDIVMLKPDDAAFFSSRIIAPNRKRLVEIMKEMGISDANLEMGLWGVKEKTPIRRLQVGLKWQRS